MFIFIGIFSVTRQDVVQNITVVPGHFTIAFSFYLLKMTLFFGKQKIQRRIMILLMNLSSIYIHIYIHVYVLAFNF